MQGESFWIALYQNISDNSSTDSKKKTALGFVCSVCRDTHVCQTCNGSGWQSGMGDIHDHYEAGINKIPCGIWAHPTNPVEGCADASPKTMLPNDT